MAFDETQSNEASNGDSIHVESHHRTQMTFTDNELVGSDPTVGAAQTDPNLVNPWGISESPTSRSGFPTTRQALPASIR